MRNDAGISGNLLFPLLCFFMSATYLLFFFNCEIEKNRANLGVLNLTTSSQKKKRNGINTNWVNAYIIKLFNLFATISILKYIAFVLINFENNKEIIKITVIINLVFGT